MLKTINSLTVILITALFLSCSEELAEDLIPVPTPEPSFMDISGYYQTPISGRAAKPKYGIYMAEYLTIGEDQKMGNTVFFMDVGNRQLLGDFVPALSLDGTADVSYYVDQNRPSNDLPIRATETAIDNAMSTWNNLICSDLGMTKAPFNGNATGLVAAVFGFGGSFDYFADVIHNGWMPAAFFEALEPGGSTFILGVTFTIVFLDENGDLLDTDNNGKYDVAWREIYYNDAFNWQIGSTFDVETVALHEAGHGLSQAHFGKAFVTNKNGKLHFSPRAVMNAAYSGVQRSIKRTDNSGHCSNWSQWPYN